jgi:hypothetical protein
MKRLNGAATGAARVLSVLAKPAEWVGTILHCAILSGHKRAVEQQLSFRFA